MTDSQGSGGPEHMIKVRRREDYAPEEWARLQERWDEEAAVHGAGYCDQPRGCSICMFRHYPVAEVEGPDDDDP
jgi:hypothetical protein